MMLKSNLKPRRFYAFTFLTLLSFMFTFETAALSLFVIAFAIATYKSYKNGTLSFEELNLDTWPSYNTQTFQRLTFDYESITSFEEVKFWDDRAEKEIICMNEYNEKLEIQIKNSKQKLTILQLENSELTFFNKVFRYRTRERFIEHYVDFLQTLVISNLQEDLKSKIDFSPNNKEEQKLILSKLQDLKLDLNLDIKNVAIDMKDVKDHARLRSAEISNSYFSTPTSRRIDRQSNAKEKNEAIARLEARKRSIAQKVYSIEKQIIWVKRIKDSKKTSTLDIKAS